ncbi:MAG TPA: carbon monoxide dehydrogenase subunit G [Dehalococcoidia bacterium]|nr:carbon monoxide dehydrogenase subunit G [Dehalococcoidia bacterium]
MKVSGSYQFDAPPQKVWDTLMEPETLSGCIPGCDGFNSTGPDQYQAVVNVGVGPVRGRYNAKIALLDQHPPTSYRLSMEGSGPAGFVNGTASVTLTEAGDKTSVQVDGDAQVGGTVARVGQRLIGSVAKTLMDRFFGCLNEAVR